MMEEMPGDEASREGGCFSSCWWKFNFLLDGGVLGLWVLGVIIWSKLLL